MTSNDETVINKVNCPIIKLSYFPIEGFGECVRLALVLSGTEFVDERVSYNDWFTSIKPTTPYGNLPIMTIDNGPMRTQSKAMLRWVGATKSETLYQRNMIFDIEEAIGVIEDYENVWRPVMWPFLYSGKSNDYYQKTDDGKQELKKIRENFLQVMLPVYVKYFTNLIEQRGAGKWLASIDEPTIADCLLIPLLRSLTKGTYDFIPTSSLDQYPSIVDYVKRFCALPLIVGRYKDGIY